MLLTVRFVLNGSDNYSHNRHRNGMTIRPTRVCDQHVVRHGKVSSRRIQLWLHCQHNGAILNGFHVTVAYIV